MTGTPRPAMLERLGLDRRVPGPRYPALDVARFFAIAGMMAAHLWPATLVAVVSVPNGYPSTLFAVLGGFTAVLSTGRLWAAGNYRAARVSLLTRGSVVAVLGLPMTFIPSLMMPVLVYYGVTLMVAAALLGLRSRWLFLGAAILALTGTWIAAGITSWLGTNAMGAVDLSSVPAVFGTLLFTGPYPVVTWLAYMCIGMGVCKLMLQARADGRLVAWCLRGIALSAGLLTAAIAGGLWYLRGVVAPREAAKYGGEEAAFEGLRHQPPATLVSPPPAGWDRVFTPATHSGSLIDIVGTAAAAILLILTLTLVLRFSSSAVRVVLAPLAAAGTIPLTVYVGHFVLGTIAFIPFLFFDPSTLRPMAAGQGLPWWFQSPAIWAIQIALALIVGLACAKAGKRGPLEALTSRFAARTVRKHTTRPTPSQPVEPGQGAHLPHSAPPERD